MHDVSKTGATVYASERVMDFCPNRNRIIWVFDGVTIEHKLDKFIKYEYKYNELVSLCQISETEFQQEIAFLLMKWPLSPVDYNDY